MEPRKILLAAAFGLYFYTMPVHAILTTVDNGLGVYDSGLNATWTSDANLLGTMEANPATYGYASESALITAIINANGGAIHDTPNYYDGSYNNYNGDNGLAYSGVYTLGSSDFNESGLGTADWFGAQAFVNFLNSINYGNSSQWALPTTVDNISSFNFPPDTSSSQMAELFYSELGGTANSFNPVNSHFSNERVSIYWSGTEHSSDPSSAWTFYTFLGLQDYDDNKNDQFYAWEVSPGQLSAVPLPGAVWFFTSALAGFGLFGRRKGA